MKKNKYIYTDSTNSLPTISIIMPVYNRSKVIERAINSVLGQSYTNFELIIVDDCSTDNTFEIISQISDSRVKVFRLDKNSGAAAARNYGIRQSSGRYISFLDSDDYFESTFLEESFKTIKDTPDNIGFMWTGSNIWQGSNIHSQVWIPERKETSHLTFLHDLKIGTGAGITVKREVFINCGYFDERLPAAEDTEFFFRITKSYDYVYAPIHLVNIYRNNDDRMSKNFINIANAYNIFLPSYFYFIDRHPVLQKKFYYKMMWLNFHLKDRKKAEYFYNRIPSNFKSYKIMAVWLLYRWLPLKSASLIHRQISN